MINSARVEEIFVDCLFETDEDVKDPVMVESVMFDVGFNPAKLVEHTPEITGMIDELPNEFKEGWSFLNLCMDKNDRQWTGEHRICDLLVALGIGIGRMKFCLPREFWQVMPGGVPYVQVVEEVA